METGVMLNHALSASSLLKKGESRSSLTLKWVDNNIVDVFKGSGWENWSRFEKKGNHFKMVAGQPLTNQEYLELKNECL